MSARTEAFRKPCPPIADWVPEVGEQVWIDRAPVAFARVALVLAEDVFKVYYDYRRRDYSNYTLGEKRKYLIVNRSQIRPITPRNRKES